MEWKALFEYCYRYARDASSFIRSARRTFDVETPMSRRPAKSRKKDQPEHTAMLEKLILITTTSDDRAELEKIVAHLVQEKLAACCQIGGPITSWYVWKGETVSKTEWVCSIKTVERHYLKTEEAILKIHHYETPQVISVDISVTAEAYEDWVRSSTDT